MSTLGKGRMCPGDFADAAFGSQRSAPSTGGLSSNFCWDCNQLRQAAEQIQRNLQRWRKEWPKYLPVVALWLSTFSGVPHSVEVTGMGFAWGNNDGFRLFLWPWWDEALCKPLGRKFHEGYNVPPRPGRKAALQLLGRNTWGNRRIPSPSALLCVGFPLPLPVDKSVLIQLCLSRCIHADFVW